MQFEIVGAIEQVETIASGTGVNPRASSESVRARSVAQAKRRCHGALANGKLRRVELHWYEAHGIGKRDFKIKSYLDQP